MADNSEFQVGVDFVVVPDGVRIAGSSTFLRFSVAVSPSVDPPSGRVVDLRNWPTEVADVTRRLRVATGKIEGATIQKRTIASAAYLKDAVKSDTPAGFDGAATRLWKRVFDNGSGDSDSGFRSLLAALRAKTVGPKPEGSTLVGSYQSADLAKVIDALYGTRLAATFLGRFVAQAQRSALMEPSSSLRPDFDGSVLPLEWWRSFQEGWIGVGALGDPVSVLTARASRERVAVTPDMKSLQAVLDEVEKEMAQGGLLFTGSAVSDTASAVEKQLSTTIRTLSETAQRFVDELGSNALWAMGNEAPLAADGRAMLKEIVRFEKCWGVGEVPVDTDSGDEAAEAAGRKYSAILSYPTLAKYLGLIIDFEINATAFLGETSETSRVYGAVAVDSPDGNDNWLLSQPEKLGWTAFVFQGHKERPYFGPCAAQESVDKKVDPKQLYIDGLLNLNAQFAGDRRFVLETLDVTGTIVALRERAGDIVQSDRLGRAQRHQSRKLADRRTRGITLIDRGHKPEGDAVAGIVKITDADDLVRGVRVDVAIPPRKSSPSWRDKSRWRPLVARALTFGGRDVDPKFVAHPAVARIRARDDGHVRAMTSERTTEQAGQRKTTIVAHPELFSWLGESLAVPSIRNNGARSGNQPDGRTVWPDPYRDLAIDIDFDLPQPDEAERLPAPLRELHSYVFGARLCLVNGCGLSFDDGVGRYIGDSAALVLGKADGTPYVYERREEIQAPDVLLRWDERLVTARRLSDIPGESIDVLVVRSGGVETSLSQRFAVPPRTTFDSAEQFGCFDTNNEPTPVGAFMAIPRVSLDPALGAFPVARNGSWTFSPHKHQQVARKAPQTIEPSRGSVLVLDKFAGRPATEFYPDPWARRMHGRLLQNGEASPFLGTLAEPVPFWSTDRSFVDAAPVVIELKRAKRGAKEYRAWFDHDDAAEPITPLHSSDWVWLRKISIALQPAETVDLEIWSVPDPQRLANGHRAVTDALSLLAGLQEAQRLSRVLVDSMDASAAQVFSALVSSLLSTDKAAQSSIIESLLAQAPLAQVTTKRIVRLVHAVDRPLAKPAFVPGSSTAGLQFHPVVITVGGDVDPQQAIRQSWNEYVTAHEEANEDPSIWPSEPGGTTTFFVGALTSDRPSTGRIRCEARWAEHGPENLRFDSKTGTWRYIVPFNHAQLFSIDEISVRDPVRDLNVDLLRDDDHYLRALSHAFVNGKARHLALRLIGTSRFTNFYRPETNLEQRQREETGVGRYEVGTPPFEQSTARIWVPCVFRPPPPEIDAVIPVFRWRTNRLDEGREIQWRRETTLRIFLKSWYASGEGEMLGLVCWPENLVSPDSKKEIDAAAEIVRTKDLCDLEKTGRYSQYLTRWGSDPVHLSGPLDDLISADRFSDFDGKASGLLLTIVDSDLPPNKDEPNEPPLPVSVVAYTPRLDPTNGFFCDVTIDHGPSYFPFVQMGLSRYQSHAAQGLELSRPVATYAQIPPRREGRVSFKDDRHLVLEVHGVGYHRSETGTKHAADRALTDFPLLNVRLLQAARPDWIPERENTIDWRPVLDGSGKPVEQLRLRPIQRGPEIWWICEMTLPQARRSIRYGLVVEEVELMAADEVTLSGPGTECRNLAFTTTLQERGPVFSHVIDLR